MQPVAKNLKEKKMPSAVVTTLAFNTLIAIVLYYLVLKTTPFSQVFVVSQITGFSICCSMAIAKQLVDAKKSVTAIAGYTVGMVTGVLMGSVLSWLFLYLSQGQDFALFMKDVFIYTLVFGVVFGVPITYFFSSQTKIIASERKIQEEKIKRLTLEKESAVTAIKLLQAQIEPHFLFNTLSTVISLVDIDVEKAKKMLVDINDYLRISLQRLRQETVTLQQEFEFITRYLDILKIRMGNRLSYELNATSDHLEKVLPPMILQPIVENAVKHGLAPKPEGGQITIDCFSDDHYLKIVIADTGLGFGHQNGRTGIGLNNVSTRLEYMYGHQARFIVTENKPSGVKAIIEVPI